MNGKSFFYGVIAALGIFLAGERAYHTFTWASRVNLEAKAGAATYTFLTESIGRDKSGKDITRAQVLEAFIQQAKRASESASGSGSNGSPR